MPQVLDRARGPVALPSTAGGRARPVVLVTICVPVDPDAERVAIEAALEVSAKLFVANMLTLPPYPLTLRLAPDAAILPHEEALEAVRATAQRAVALGVRTELLRVSSPRPLRALVELARDLQAGLLVFGPERARIKERRYRSAVRVVRRDAPCLVWVAPDA